MEIQYTDKRLTRQFISSSLVISTATYSSSLGKKKSQQRGKRGSGVQKKMVKKSSQRVIEKFKKCETL